MCDAVRLLFQLRVVASTQLAFNVDYPPPATWQHCRAAVPRAFNIASLAGNKKAVVHHCLLPPGWARVGR